MINTDEEFKRPSCSTKANPILHMPELFEAALNEFSTKSFAQASLNDIIKAIGMNKGSFYYRFADKLDLYLCLMHKIGLDKQAYLSVALAQADFPNDFFDQLKMLVKSGLDYARHEPRYYSFWRRYLSETPQIKQAVKDAFDGISRDGMTILIEAAQQKGQFDSSFDVGFLSSIISLLFNNIDTLLSNEMTDCDITALIDQLIEMLKRGLLKK